MDSVNEKDESYWCPLKLQKTSDEMDEEDMGGADWQYGYDCVLKEARKAIARITALEAENAKLREAAEAVCGSVGTI